MELKADFLIIGSGISGLTLALKVSRVGSVCLVTKTDIKESATYYAQGGIAGVVSPDDSFERHIMDTETAGAGLCHRDVVKAVIEEGPALINELRDLGVHFSGHPSGGLDLGKEGGHSRRRVVHAGDFTGRVIEEALVNAVEEKDNISIHTDHIAVNLIKEGSSGPHRPGIVRGAYVLDKKTGEVHTFLARNTVLATGGAGKVYLYTSNPDVATGDGIAMAARAGAVMSNMEFIQFHPTCLYHPRAKNFLISEAVRGEGAILRLADGSAFMKKYHPMAELGPRDIVARAIDFELKKSGSECVYLDITERPASFIKDRFPNIYERCLSFGFDITIEPIPVVPAAHYVCGGIKTDMSGRTNLKGLYAIGESACTGMHGANRLASNSLLEGLVLSNRAARHMSELITSTASLPAPSVPPWQPGSAVRSDEAVVITQNWEEIRRFMWNYVGIVRSDRRLERALRRITLLEKEIEEYYWDFTITSDLVELRNIATVAGLIIRSAIMRKESRGLHYNIDYPQKDDKAYRRDTEIRL
ncbi:MAG: L-aspartate oxidase [Thermodesulfobacteriota bacterium]